MGRHFKRRIYRMLYLDLAGVWPVDPDSPEGRILEHTRKTRQPIDPYFDHVRQRRMYETPEELEERIEKYFDSCLGPMYNKFGQPIRNEKGEILYKVVKPYTISGLARALGLSRASLINYRDFAIMGDLPYEFVYTVDSARARVEEYAEMRLYDQDGSRGADFVLTKGFNWRSEKEDQDMKISRKKFDLQKEKHRAELDLLKQGEGIDGDIHVTITRANKD